MSQDRSVKGASTSDSPLGCQHYAEVGSVPWNIKKYYDQRFSIFSRYDEGIWMTEDAWFGVTPEPAALKIAQHISIAAPPEKAILVDCFAGVGGNTIAFARSGRWTTVVAIEKDPKAITCGKHNASIYGVDDRISWYQGDCFEILSQGLSELSSRYVVFASPPWGGPSYTTDAVFDLSRMQPYNLWDLLDGLRGRCGDVVLYLPRNSDMRQLAQAATENEKITVIHYCIEGASKAMCAYFGTFSFPREGAIT